MRTRSWIRRTPLLLACGLGLTLFNCAADDEEAVTIDTQNALELSVAAGESIPLRTELDEATAVVITVDCGVPDQVDIDGALISVDADTLEQASALAGKTRAAYWRWAGVLAAGPHTITLNNDGNRSASCAVSMSAQSSEGSCTSHTVHRSATGSAVHLPVGSGYGEWEDLPASGNHWGAWATWGTVYDKPVLRGFYLHNLEHGGVVMSYGCESADESDACADAERELIELANAFGQNRIIVTPDPDQPTMFALRTWRYAYSSDCLDAESALSFMQANFRNGREDIEADPPLPFDPTSSDNVPCEVLMAAPDGC